MKNLIYIFLFTITFQLYCQTNELKALATQKILKLYISKGENTDEACIRFKSPATINFDGSFDAYKLFSYIDSIPQLFSLISKKTNASINTYPELREEVSIPVGIKVGKKGIYSLKVSQISGFLSTDDIFLNDKKEKKMINLKETNVSYDFETSCGIDTSRFEVMFVPQQAITSLGQVKVKADIKIYNAGNLLFLSNLPYLASATIELIDITGKVVYKEKTDLAEEHVINLNSVWKGIFFVKLSNKESEIVKKVCLQ